MLGHVRLLDSPGISSVGAKLVALDAAAMGPEPVGQTGPQECLAMDPIVIIGALGRIQSFAAIQAGQDDILRLSEPPVCCPHDM